MDAETGAAGFPVQPLFGGGFEESGVPGEGDDNGSTVEEVDGHCIFGEADVLDALAGPRIRNGHAISPGAIPYFD